MEWVMSESFQWIIPPFCQVALSNLSFQVRWKTENWEWKVEYWLWRTRALREYNDPWNRIHTSRRTLQDTMFWRFTRFCIQQQISRIRMTFCGRNQKKRHTLIPKLSSEIRKWGIPDRWPQAVIWFWQADFAGTALLVGEIWRRANHMENEGVRSEWWEERRGDTHFPWERWNRDWTSTESDRPKTDWHHQSGRAGESGAGNWE